MDAQPGLDGCLDFANHDFLRWIAYGRSGADLAFSRSPWTLPLYTATVPPTCCRVLPPAAASTYYRLAACLLATTHRASTRHAVPFCSCRCQLSTTPHSTPFNGSTYFLFSRCRLLTWFATCVTIFLNTAWRCWPLPASCSCQQQTVTHRQSRTNDGNRWLANS